MTATPPDGPRPASPRNTLRAGERWLRKAGLRLVGYAIAAYLLVRLVPALQEALEDLERPSGWWLVAVFALEIVSEMGFVISWHAIVDPESRLGSDGHGRIDLRLAWAQLGAGMFIPGGSLSSVGAGAWLLHRLGMPLKLITERQLSLSLLNTAIDGIVLVLVGTALATGLLPGEANLLLTALPAAVGALGLGGALALAGRARRRAREDHGNADGRARERARHPRVAAVTAALARAVLDTSRVLSRRSGAGAVAGALAYLFFDVLVLFLAFAAVRAQPVPPFGVVVMAYIIGALGGSIPLPAAIGTVAGMVGMFALYGVGRDTAVAAVLLYQAVGLLVPLIGGAVAYLLLRREFAAREGRPEAAQGG